MDWFVGITTCPRPGQSLLNGTVFSLAESGWQSVLVFDDPEKHGAWQNFLSVVRVGVEMGAERIAVAQDDILTAVGLREYLERTMTQTGWHSPYLAGYAREFVPPGWNPIPKRQIHRAHGGCFLACTRETAERFLKSIPGDTGPNGTDTWITKWSRRTETPLWYHNPSLVQHLGKHSTIHPDVPMDWMRTATNFCADARRLEC